MILNSTSCTSPNEKKSNILVTVRVRPLNTKEKQYLEPENDTPFPEIDSISQNNSFGKKIINVIDRNILVFDPLNPNSKQSFRIPSHNNRRNKDIRYAFDHVFDENCTQQEVFENTTKFLIDDVLNGYNATVFAYGATGCGKTYTITGTTEDPGIIPRTMNELFKKIEEYKDNKIIESSLSYLEVYNETIRDLLAPDNKTLIPLNLREDSNGVIVSGLSEHHPNNVDDVIKLLIKGNNNRTKAATEANKVSSRSHAVLQLRIKQREREANIATDYTSAVLSIIDLAGSERASVSKNQGERLVEGANINRSLLALGNCINALCTNSYHIPYRDSKLTRLLKFSLGGNCKVVMITNVSPSYLHYEETHNTLKYANRAKNIKTKIEQNLIHVESHIAQYPKIIQELRSEIDELKAKLRTFRRKSTRLIQDEETVLQQRRIFEDLLVRVRKCYAGIQNKELDCSLITTEIEKNTSQINFLQGLINSINYYTELSKQPVNPLTQYTKPLSQGIEELEFLNETLKQKLSIKRGILDRYNAHIIDLQEGKLAKTLNLDQRRYLDQEIKLLGLSSMNSQLATKLTSLQVNMENELSTQQNIASQHLGHLFSIQAFISHLETNVTTEEQEHIEEVLQGALSIFIEIAGRASINNVPDSSTAYLYSDQDEDEDDYMLSDVSFCENDKLEDIALANTPSRRKSISMHSLRKAYNDGDNNNKNDNKNIVENNNDDKMEISFDNEINNIKSSTEKIIIIDDDTNTKDDDMQLIDDNSVYDEPTSTADFYKEYTTTFKFNGPDNNDDDNNKNDMINENNNDLEMKNTDLTSTPSTNNIDSTIDNTTDGDVIIIQTSHTTPGNSKIKMDENSKITTPQNNPSSLSSAVNSLTISSTSTKKKNNDIHSSPILKTPQSKFSFQTNQEKEKTNTESSTKKKKTLFSFSAKPILRTPTPKKSILKTITQSSPLSNKSSSIPIKRTRSIEIVTPNQKRSKIIPSNSPTTKNEPFKSKLYNKSITPIKESSSQQKERMLRRKSLIPIINKVSSYSNAKTPSPNSRSKRLSRLSLGPPLHYDKNNNPFLSLNDTSNIFDDAGQESSIFITPNPSEQEKKAQSDKKKNDDKYRRKSMFIFRSTFNKK